MVEHAWKTRSEADLSCLRVLALGDDSAYFRLRFDGGEFGEGSWFQDLMFWSSEPEPWQALSVGNFESHAILSLAGFFLDVGMGVERGVVGCNVEPGGLSFTARLISDDLAEVSVFLGGDNSVVVFDGEPSSVPVVVPRAHMLGAAQWLSVEASRFWPGDTLTDRAPWIPLAQEERTIEELVMRRTPFLETERQRLGTLHAWVVERNRELGFPE